MKPAIFHPKAREAIRGFPVSVRQSLGKAIFDLQKGAILSMPLSKPIPSVALGVEEIRVKDASGIFRTFYYKKAVRGILVFHAFVKKRAQDSTARIELGRKRLGEMFDEKS